MSIKKQLLCIDYNLQLALANCKLVSQRLALASLKTEVISWDHDPCLVNHVAKAKTLIKYLSWLKPTLIMLLISSYGKA